MEGLLRESKIIKTSGLRVYINRVGTKPCGDVEVFYSRRAAGPFYYWRYEGGVRRWRGYRVHLSDSAVKALCKASWQAVPGELQARMVEHYLE